MSATFVALGRVARDPENRNGVVSFAIAMDQGWGEKKTAVFWKCKAFGKTGERIMGAWSKGKPMMAHGRLEQDRWTAKDGTEKVETVLIVGEAHFVPSDTSQRSAPAPQQPEDDVPF